MTRRTRAEVVAVGRSRRLLLSELRAAGWGELAGAEFHGVRAALDVLVAYGAPTVVATAAQVAERAGYSEGHTRRCLHVLERMGLVRWFRGGITEGRPRPGWFRVRYAALEHALARAKDLARERRQQRATTTNRRIARTVRSSYLWRKSSPNRHHPLSSQPNMMCSLPLREGEDARPDGPGGVLNHTEQPDTKDPTVTHECIHGTADISACGECRAELRRNPRMDVRTLWANDNNTLRTMPAGFRARVRAAIRQANHDQGTLL